MQQKTLAKTVNETIIQEIQEIQDRRVMQVINTIVILQDMS